MASNASTASAGRTPTPPALRIIKSRGTRKDGLETDSGGRPIAPAPEFSREPPSKPADLSLDASWLWDQVVEQMTSIGLLKPLDGPALEIAAETFARWRQAVRMRQDNDITSTNSQGLVAAPWVGIEERASKEFRAWCAEFGFTPAAERNLVAPGDRDGGQPDNPF